MLVDNLSMAAKRTKDIESCPFHLQEGDREDIAIGMQPNLPKHIAYMHGSLSVYSGPKLPIDLLLSLSLSWLGDETTRRSIILLIEMINRSNNGEFSPWTRQGRRSRVSNLYMPRGKPVKIFDDQAPGDPDRPTDRMK